MLTRKCSLSCQRRRKWWLDQRKVRLHENLPVGDVVALLGDACSIADAEAVIQQALNRAVSRRASPGIIERSDVMFATRAVLSG